MAVQFLTYSNSDPDPVNDDCYGTANINLANGNVWVCNNLTRRYELSTQLRMVSQASANRLPVSDVSVLSGSSRVLSSDLEIAIGKSYEIESNAVLEIL